MAGSVERLVWRDVELGEIATPARPMRLTLGVGSGLTRRAGDRPGRVFGVTDRGPNLFVSDAVEHYGLEHLRPLLGMRGAKVMPAPDIGPEIVELEVAGDAVRLVRRLPMVAPGGRRLSCLPLPGDTEGEQAFGLNGEALGFDVLGADPEAIAAAPNGGFWIGEEYGPSILKVDADGVVRERWVPAGMEQRLAGDELPVRGVLPAEMARRRFNRGIEGLCASDDGRWLYVAMQSALAGEDQWFLPVWKLDAGTGAPAGRYDYPFDAPQTFARDAARRVVGLDDLKISELTWVGEDRVIVLERIARSTKLYEADLARPAEKRLLMSSDAYAEMGGDMEGVALLGPGELLMCSDNDFGVEGAVTEFWRVRF